MPANIVRTADVYDFSVLPNPLRVGKQPVTLPEHYDSHLHPQVGQLDFRNVTFPHLHIVDMKWRAAETLTLLNEIPTDTINFNYQLEGENFIDFSEMSNRIVSKGGEHSIFYHPQGSFANQAKAGKSISVLHISLDKSFFADSVGADDKWGEQILTNIHLKRSFTASAKPMPLTPEMRRLIDEIRRPARREPMRNMLLQSKVLELIALQLEQIRTPSKGHPEVRKEDIEKLHALKTHIDANYLADLSLGQLSKYCLLNEFKVKKGFKLLFGDTVFGYIKKKRMEYALNLLQKKSLTVDEISMTLGYEHSHHFSAAFKTYMGVSPSSYRTSLS